MTLYETCVKGALRAYKLTLSPLIGRQCRFLPTCSEYAAEALISHGPVRGGWLAVRRVCRCNPWGGSGYDPPPEKPDGARRRNWTCEKT
ncbi:MAG: membrane protein insertion efficiency factor YidD [Phenylobacterium sp.]|uniref:membrane protein insertion efficiency factor YidD n=1 Tax=Phenylobacterium sp. TaxID=1871053 RepID=UPI00391D80FC